MLSWSAAETNQPLDLAAITGNGMDPLIPGGQALVDYVTTVLSGGSVEEARDRVRDLLGEAATIDAAAVAGNFEMMNRIADGVGMPVGRGTRTRMKDVIEDLGLDRFPHA